MVKSDYRCPSYFMTILGRKILNKISPKMGLWDPIATPIFQIVYFDPLVYYLLTYVDSSEWNSKYVGIRRYK